MRKMLSNFKANIRIQVDATFPNSLTKLQKSSDHELSTYTMSSSMLSNCCSVAERAEKRYAHEHMLIIRCIRTTNNWCVTWLACVLVGTRDSYLVLGVSMAMGVRLFEFRHCHYIKVVWLSVAWPPQHMLCINADSERPPLHPEIVCMEIDDNGWAWTGSTFVY